MEKVIRPRKIARQPVNSVLKTLEIGQSAVFKITALRTIYHLRSYASTAGKNYGMKFSVSKGYREATITRIA